MIDTARGRAMSDERDRDNEPNWGRLPFPTDGSTWKPFSGSEFPEPDAPRVWVERDACFDFAARSERPVPVAFAGLGAGVLRWAERHRSEGTDLTGQTLAVEFAGAPGAAYMVTCWPAEPGPAGGGVHFLLYLHPDHYRRLAAGDTGHGADGGPNDAGGADDDKGGNVAPAAPGKRVVRGVRPPARSDRNIYGPGKPDGKLLKKWMA